MRGGWTEMATLGIPGVRLEPNRPSLRNPRRGGPKTQILNLKPSNPQTCVGVGPRWPRGVFQGCAGRMDARPMHTPAPVAAVLRGYLAHKKQRAPRTLEDYA